MSMTYYAVTDDPNELAHFGILGMKWGRRRTPEQLGHPRHSGSKRPRSAAYKKAQSKLGKIVKSGIKKVEANWREYNSPANKQMRAEKKYYKQTEKAIEKARKGKLKYGKLDDYQVQRINERLNLERQARELSGKEQRFRTRLAKSIGEGVISGIGQGFGRRASEWISRGSTLKTDRLRAEQQERADLHKARSLHKQQLAFDREDNSNANLRRKARNEFNKEFYKTSYEEGMNPISRRLYAVSPKRRANYLSEVKDRNKLSDIRKTQRDSFDKAYYSNMGKNAAEWVKSKAGNEKSNNDWNSKQSYPRLMTGLNSYPVTNSTYRAPESNTVIYVDPKGVARQKQRSGRKKFRVNYD